MALMPQPVADSRLRTSRPAPALIRARQRNPFRNEARHAGPRVETHRAGQPRIDHHPDALNGQARFGNRGRQHDLPLRFPDRSDGGVLLRSGKIAVQRADGNRPGPHIVKQRFNFADFPGSRQEDQQASGLLTQGAAHHVRHPRFHGHVGTRRRAVPGFHGPYPAFAPQDRDRFGGIPFQQPEQRPGVQRGGHDEQPQIVAQSLLAIQSEGKPQVGVETALMKFVKDETADPPQFGIVLQEAGQYALRDHRDPGGGAYPALQPHAVADRLADLFTEQGRHVPGGVPGGHAPGLKHQDTVSGEPVRTEQGQRHPRGLASAGGGLKNAARTGGERRMQLRQQGLNGQGSVIGHALP